jgi:glycerol-3-phosphate acyltransferase PlsY
MNELGLILLAYFIGSVPTALLVSKRFFGIDIRDYGSGNMGATNTYRVLGSKFGTLVMVVDMLKGFVASSLWILLPFYASHEFQRTNLQIGLGLAAVIGHILPIFAQFRGGKGIATLFGMVLAIQPMVAVYSVAVFLVVLYLTRYVSLSSILASVAFTLLILVIFNEKEPLYRIFSIAVALLVILTHQKNISRLIKGNESKAAILKYRDRRKMRRMRN